MPDVTGLELIAHELRDRVPGSIRDTHYPRAVATLILDPDRVLEALKWLRDDETQRYTFLASLHGSDYLPDGLASGSITSCSTWSGSSECT